MAEGTMASTAKRKSNDIVWDSESARGTLTDQIRWLIALRWLAVLGTLLGIFISTSRGLLPIFSTDTSQWLLGWVGVLFISNVVYYLIASGRKGLSERKQIIFAFVQVEADLVILTGLLHFSGGVMNPFVLFYVFHVILATIILPKHHSRVVVLSALFLYGGMVLGEMSGCLGFGHYPMLATQGFAAWQDMGYVLWSLSAFLGMVILSHYLTWTVVARMRRQEQEGVRHYELLRAVVNSMSEGLVFLTSEGRLSVCNPAACQWVTNGLAGAGSIRSEDFPPAVQAHFRELIKPVGGSKERSEIIYYGSREKGEKYIEMKSCSVRGGDNSHLGYVVVGNDLTEHKKLERNLRMRTAEVTKINEKMRQSQMDMAEREKMSALGQMASGIAHEIGNPLNSLASIAQSLGRKYQSEPDQKQFELINDQIRRISKILAHMLELARPSSSNYTWMNVNHVIDGALALIKYDKRSQNVTIHNVADETLPMIWFRQDNLEQVLLNILLNSLHALDVRGVEGEKVLEVRRKLQEDRIIIEVSDNGVGMSESVRAHAFEPFFTTKEAGKGTGLGLYISRNVMEESGGSISLEDNPGGGVRVVIEFPVGRGEGRLKV